MDIFLRAVSNRAKYYIRNDRKKSLSAEFRGAIIRRLTPPPILPEFLRRERARFDPFRVKRALHELESFSIIKYDKSGESFSLHRLVHSWARERLTQGGQALWAHVGLNTLLESLSLPPGRNGQSPEKYHRDILPHLGACLTLCPIKILDYDSLFGKSRYSLGFAWKYVSHLRLQNEVMKAAKCGYVFAECGRFRDAARYLLMVKAVLTEDQSYRNEWTERAMLTLAGIYRELGRFKAANALQQGVGITPPTAFRSELSEILLAIDQLGGQNWPH